jgi:hypothetical protein
MKFSPNGKHDGHYPLDGKTWYPVEKQESSRDSDGTAKFIAVAFAFLMLYILWRVLVLWVKDTPWAQWTVQHVADAATWIWSLF